MATNIMNFWLQAIRLVLFVQRRFQVNNGVAVDVSCIISLPLSGFTPERVQLRPTHATDRPVTGQWLCCNGQCFQVDLAPFQPR